MNLNMPGNLYLAQFVRAERTYPDRKEKFLHQYRLVWAENEGEAKAKLLKVEDPYGFSIDVEGLELHEAIV